MKKLVSLMLIVSLIFTATCISYGEPRPIPTPLGMYKHLDIGAFYTWGTGGKWDPAAPGSTQKINATLTFPNDVYIVDVYPYSADKFDWNDKEYNTYNCTKFLFDKKSFVENYYYDYSAEIGSVSSAGNKGTKVNLSYNATLAGDGLNINGFVKAGTIDEFYARMGGKESVKTLSPITAKRIDEAVVNGLGEIPEGRVYFLPVIIEYSHTDVALKGTAKSSKNHSIKIVMSGGVNGVAFCNTVSKTIKINGNMYEDDWTVDRRK